MPEVENQGDTDFKATRKLRVFHDTPVTSSSSFKQEFLHRLDNITYVWPSFLAHLWGAYAIPVALSGVRRPLYVVCRLCPP